MAAADKMLETLMNKMDNFISSRTVIGEAIQIGEVILLPIVDVSFGVGAGGIGEGTGDKDNSKGGGGLGAKITPSAVLVIHEGTVQLVNVKNQDSVNKLIDMVPGVLSKLNFGSLFNKKDASKSDTDAQDDVKFKPEIYTEK